ncbi:hypothetical protein Tco_1081697 [Tanacetum coccineum]|uniref:Uncharacterized protein n=1 Tax=Tanacetum coccineum TaxID=301880 RepID=A0ABQ5HYC4_9ASTR
MKKKNYTKTTKTNPTVVAAAATVVGHGGGYCCCCGGTAAAVVVLLLPAMVATVAAVMPGTKNYGCGYFDWKDAFDERLMVSSSSTSEGSSGPYRSEQPQPSYSPGPYRSAQPQSSYSSGPHRSVQPQPSYSSGPCRSEPIECSNCKVKDLTINRLESRNRALKARLRMLEARLEMERNPEDHACQSGAILNELLDDMEDLHME